jgi:hypothetical protein
MSSKDIRQLYRSYILIKIRGIRQIFPSYESDCKGSGFEFYSSRIIERTLRIQDSSVRQVEQLSELVNSAVWSVVRNGNQKRNHSNTICNMYCKFCV